MGTNFYWITPKHLPVPLPTGESVDVNIEHDNPSIHIGKRSAAGPYCWKCNVTLCVQGEKWVHYSGKEWHDACPKCGEKQKIDEGLRDGPSAIELGFAKPRTERPNDVRGCSSFSWAQDPGVVRQICEQRLDETLIVDEYDRTMTCGEFLSMLKNNCPIEYTESVGTYFS